MVVELERSSSCQIATILAYPASGMKIEPAATATSDSEHTHPAAHLLDIVVAESPLPTHNVASIHVSPPRPAGISPGQ